MPTFEIEEDAFSIATGAVKPVVSAPLPGLSEAARTALHASERHTRSGTVIATRRITAERAVTRELRDWFITVEETLLRSEDADDRSRSRTCAAAANVLIRAFMMGADGRRVR